MRSSALRLGFVAPWVVAAGAALEQWALPRSLLAPPLAPSFEKLQALVNDVTKDRNISNEDPTFNETKILPCLLRGGGCASEESQPGETKKKGNEASSQELRKTQASIESAVSKLQKDLDRKTAEVVKEIERRAAEMRRQISLEAEQLIEAVKYLVTMLSDSVTRADEMGQDFVREWFDEAKNRYVGANQTNFSQQKLEDDLKETNYAESHADMVSHLKESVQKTRERYGEPKNHGGLSLDEQLGVQDSESSISTTPRPEDDQEEGEDDKNDSKKNQKPTTTKPPTTTTPRTKAAPRGEEQVDEANTRNEAGAYGFKDR